MEVASDLTESSEPVVPMACDRSPPVPVPSDPSLLSPLIPDLCHLASVTPVDGAAVLRTIGPSNALTLV
jgi:hypothetical protein